MLVIADSGSSTTQWALVSDDGQVAQRTSEGLNPRFTTDDRFLQTVGEVLDGQHEVSHLFFYGAGCGDHVTCSRYTTLLSNLLPHAAIHVESDLIGACLAVRQAGVVGILGTGSHACFFDGTQVLSQAPSLGYVLGDEGSGNHIGRMLWHAHWHHTMPAHIERAFAQAFPLQLPEFLDNVYRQPHPNRFLAQAAPFASIHKADPFIQQLLLSSFESYLSTVVAPLCDIHNNRCLHLVGSVAWHFRNEVAIAAVKYGLHIDSTLQYPLSRLISYHLSLLKQP